MTEYLFLGSDLLSSRLEIIGEIKQCDMHTSTLLEETTG